MWFRGSELESDVDVILAAIPRCRFLSNLNKIGCAELVAACSLAAIFRACRASTRLSDSAASSNTAGYAVPSFTR